MPARASMRQPKNVKSMEDDWSGVAIGYSQGGAVAAGVLRYCQEHNETSLRLKGAVCGDGPYDPLATLKRYIEMDKLYMPVAPAMLLKGAIDTDPDRPSTANIRTSSPISSTRLASSI